MLFTFHILSEYAFHFFCPYAEPNSLLYSYVAIILLQDNRKSPKKSLFFGGDFPQIDRVQDQLFSENAWMHLFEWVKPFEMVSAPAFQVQWSFWNQIFFSH